MLGVLIDFEGIDGAGKRTQSNLLADRLRQRRLPVAVHSYPDYASRYGMVIKEFLNSRISLTVEEQLFLYLLDMIKDKDKVRQMVRQRHTVIMDRYFPSTVAYQCARGFSYEKAKRIVESTDLLVPSVIFYLQMPVDITRPRMTRRGVNLDQFEVDAEFLSKVRAMYERMIAENFPSSIWRTLDGTQQPEVIHAQILSAVEQLMSGRGR